MDQIGASDIRHYLQVDPEGLQRRIGVGQACRGRIRTYRGAMIVLRPCPTEGMHPQIHLAGQHPTQLSYVHSGTTVDFGRELFGHNIDSHSLKVAGFGAFDLV